MRTVSPAAGVNILIQPIYHTAALAAYEYLITINQEVTMVWRRTWTATTWMFIANRYLMVGLVMYTVFPYTAQVLLFSLDVATDR